MTAKPRPLLLVMLLCCFVGLAVVSDEITAQLRRRPVARDVAPAVVLPVSGQTLTLPDGDTTITAPLVLADVDRCVIRGGVNSRILYAGPPTPGVIQLARCGGCRVENLDVVVQVDGVDAGVLVTNLPGTSPVGRVSTANRFTRVNVAYDQNGHAPKYGFNIDSTALGGTDGNNDVHGFDECYARVFTKAGFRLNGSQVHQIVYNRCRAYNSAGWGGNCLVCDSGSYFTWLDGGSTGCDCDFVSNSAEIQGVIRGHNSENAKAFLKTGRVGAAYFLDVSGVRWDGKPLMAAPVVDCYGPGPFSIRNSYFSGINGVCPTFRFDSWSGPGTLPGAIDLFGVLIRQHGGTGSPGIIATVPVRWEVGSRGFRYEWVKPDGSRVDKPGDWNRPIK